MLIPYRFEIRQQLQEHIRTSVWETKQIEALKFLNQEEAKCDRAINMHRAGVKKLAHLELERWQHLKHYIAGLREVFLSYKIDFYNS